MLSVYLLVDTNAAISFCISSSLLFGLGISVLGVSGMDAVAMMMMRRMEIQVGHWVIERRIGQYSTIIV